MSLTRRLLLVSAAWAGLAVALPCRAQQCTSALAQWTRIEDGSLPPAFLARGARLPVDGVLACGDHVYVFVRAREARGMVDFCLVFFAPRPQEVARLDHRRGESASDPVEQVRNMAEHGARAREAFSAFKDGLRVALGKRYVEGRAISLARERYRAQLEVGGGQFTFEWRHRSATFAGGFFDVYYSPGAGVSPLWLFMLLYPR